MHRPPGSRFHSLQRTLALRYGATMFVALMGIAAWAYAGVAGALEAQLDREIESGAALMVDVVASGESLAGHVGSADLPGVLSELNRLVVARDSAGAVIAANSPFAAALPLDTVSFSTARAGMRSFASGTFSGISFRSVYAPVLRMRAGALRGVAVVQVAVSKEPLNRESRGILFQLICTGLLGTIVTTVGAAWLARSSLRPVSEIAAQARAVTATGAEQRITVHANVLELRDLIEVLNDMVARLERVLRHQRRIIADVGHELRTPITVIQGQIEVALRTERRPDQYQALLRSTHEEAERLGRMADELIALSRYEAGELAAHRVPCDLRELVTASAVALRHQAAGTPIEVRVPPEALEARADPRLISLVLEQLLDNAARHTPPGTAIRITAEADHTESMVTVEDTGPGVPDSLLPELAEPFFRADPARTRGGTGLGLTLASAILALHGGRLVLGRSALGGLSARITLPHEPAGPPPS